ncbi:MAG: leucyl aminopeptidase [Candidatus Wildermuthbacteria bacterium]|nr:leucyl aminopeptidase [Candidatus Wildermuthbacteria bacterium]
MKISVVSQKPQDKAITVLKLVEQRQESWIEVLPDGQRILALGIGDKNQINRRKLFILARQVIALAKGQRIKSIAIPFDDLEFSNVQLSNEEKAEVLAINFEMANFEFVQYKTPPKEGWNFVEEIVLHSSQDKAEIEKGIEKGMLIANAVNNTRILSNTPGGDMTPKILAEAARKAARETSAKVTVLEPKEMKELGMGGITGVAKGSSEEPRFIILEYYGAGKNEQPIVLIGKGVTFDTGGINLKPREGTSDMHMDMSGGAAVMHSVVLAAKMGLQKNIVGLIPAAENMPSGSSYHPGDVLRTISGKTIEVLDTDAEGRILLADALGYAKRYNPRLVIDVATLTGAAMAALGQRASAIFTTDQKLEQLFRELGEETGDYVWPMPLWEEYAEEIKGTFGDWANMGKTRYGGAITAAVFLKQFTEGYPWVHIDIAPRMTAIEGEYLAKGAAGAPVRLLIKLLQRI